MANIDVELGKSVPLYQQLASTDTGLYPLVNILDEDNNVVDQVSLAYVSNGLYRANWEPIVNAKATYFAQTIIYTDEEHTTESGIDRPGIDIIRIGPNAIGGAILGSSSGGGKSIGRFSLTRDELKLIALELFKLLEPKLQITSEVTVDDSSIRDIAAQISSVITSSVGKVEECVESGIAKVATISRETKDSVSKHVPEMHECVKEIESKVCDMADTQSDILDTIDELSVDIGRYTEINDAMSTSVSKAADKSISGLTQASNMIVSDFKKRIDRVVEDIPSKIADKIDSVDITGPVKEQISQAMSEVSGIKRIAEDMIGSATSLAVDSAAQSGNISGLVRALSKLSQPQRKAKINKIRLQWPQVYQLLINKL